MNADVFHRLLQQPSLLKETDATELETMVYQYPWFGVAQLLLAAKKKQDGVVFEKQAEKAMLYFNRQLLGNSLLKQFSDVTIQPEQDVVEAWQQKVEISGESDELEASLDAEAIIEAEDIRDEQEGTVVTDAALDAAVLLQAEAEYEAEQQIKDAETEMQAEIMIEADAERELADFVEKTDTELTADAIISADMAKEELIKKEEPAVTDNQPLFTFEPFHTVDYFASQGIKLREEKLDTDELGKQVKSFTQWLRSMKKIYVEEKKQLDSQEEEKVVSKATKSNEQTDVITETMAEVLAKQGKNAQAIDLYSKLSLLHPEKSVYFASRIQELKK